MLLVRGSFETPLGLTFDIHLIGSWLAKVLAQASRRTLAQSFIGDLVAMCFFKDLFMTVLGVLFRVCSGLV